MTLLPSITSAVPQSGVQTPQVAASLYPCSGNPNGLILAPVGSLAIDTTNQGLYTNTNGTINGWTPLIGAAGSLVASTQLPTWRKALGRVRTKAGVAKVAFVGDSTFVGEWSNGSQFSNSRVLSPHNQLAAQFVAAGVPAITDSFFGDQNLGAVNYQSSDPRVVLGSSWTISTIFQPLGKGSFTASTTTNALAFTPVSSFDTIDIYWGRSATGGSFTVNVDGGATLQTINTIGAAAQMKTTITGVTAGTHTINIQQSAGGSVYVLGAAVRTSTAPSVEMYGCGAASGVAEDYGSTGALFNLASLANIAPDLTLVNLTINDIINQGFPIATYTADIQLIITQAKLSGDCLLMIGNPTSSANFTNGKQLPYYNAVYALAATNGLAVVDISMRWGSYAKANALGLYGDTIHPNGLGYSDIAAALRKVLLNV